jgi:hypothetical protein
MKGMFMGAGGLVLSTLLLLAVAAPGAAEGFRTGLNCGEQGLVRYHGKCISPTEKAARIELEIIHAQKLVNEARNLYENASEYQVALLFDQTKQFLADFRSDDEVDEHLEEKILLLLGFLYLPADMLFKDMQRSVKDERNRENFLADHERLEKFSAEVHTPLLRLLAQKMVAYAERHGEENLRRLLSDNHLRPLLDSWNPPQ